jgi:hypothetical protein
MAEVQVKERVLDANDRCDKCSSQAYFLTILDSGELYFCRHHFLQNEEILRELAHYIIDQSHLLDQRQETGTYPELQED